MVDLHLHLVYWQCETCEDDFKINNCVADGKYCSFNFDKENGKFSIYEEIRQQCFFNFLKS
jgi:hypothetical protein